MKNLMLVSAVLISLTAIGQTKIKPTQSLEQITVKGHWGNIDLKGVDATWLSIEAIHSGQDNESERISEERLSEYVSIIDQGKELLIETRIPQGFESVDLKIELPQVIFAKVILLKGGEVSVENLRSGLEIQQLNGSVKAADIGQFALISAANGSVDISFKSMNEQLPTSLVTMNGGITVTMPAKSKRDVRLVSQKNGYVLSDFDVSNSDKVDGWNKAQYSKQPISLSGTINGGGELLFLSTQNGPLILRKR